MNSHRCMNSRCENLVKFTMNSPQMKTTMNSHRIANSICVNMDKFHCEFTPVCAPTFILSCETITPLHKKTNSRCGHTVERQITYLLTHSLTHLELTIYLLTYTEQRSIQHEPQQRMGQTNNWLYAADFVRTELSNVVWSFVSDALFQVGVRLIDIVNRSLPLQPQICNLYIK